MSKYFRFFVTSFPDRDAILNSIQAIPRPTAFGSFKIAMPIVSLAIAMIISLGTIDSAIAVTQKLQLNTATQYRVEIVFDYDDANHPAIIHEQGKGRTKTVKSMKVSFYQPSGELIASYDNIIDGVAIGNYFEFNFEPETQQLTGNIDLGGEYPGEIYLKGEVDRELSLIKVEPSGEEKEMKPF